MLDFDRLELARSKVQMLDKMGSKGFYFIFSYLDFLGKALLEEVSKILGLQYQQRAKGTVKPL